MSDYFGKETPKLGFGLMRLPKKGVRIDVEKTKEMVDLFLKSGFTYFDTAYIYPGSEKATRKALVDRYPRESYLLASKVNAFITAPSEKAAKNQFYKSLERTQAGYFDYYLLHALMEHNYKKYENYHLWDFVRMQKEKGRIRHYGFSFHGGPELLDQLLTEHPDVDFVQLQLNYADWENKRVTSRANYEVARKHGKSIVVMEPVKGGKLANPPREVRKLFESYHPDMSCASWAIRFAASLDGVITVLSGMSNLQQMQDNISFMKDFQPLNDEEQKIIQKAQKILGKSAAIACTSCHYCTSGCPKKIPIPEIFEAMNKKLSTGQEQEAVEAYQEVIKPEGVGKASDCIQCRQCENACPQHLEIVYYLGRCNDELEKSDV